TTVIALFALVAIGGPAHAVRADPNPPVVVDEETRLRKIEQQIRSLQAETANLRFENQRLRAEAHNLLAINEHVSLVELHGHPTVRFSAVNLQVVNGAGNTRTFNGTGNLLIGYNR